MGARAHRGAAGCRTRYPRDSRAGANQPARAGAAVAGRHHSHRTTAAGHAVRGQRAAVSRPVRRLAGTQCTQNTSRSPHMSTPDSKNAAIARAQFGELGPPAAGAGGQEMNLNLILDVSVTLALEVGRARMPVRDLLQLAPGVVVNEKFGIRLTDVVSATERMEQAR